MQHLISVLLVLFVSPLTAQVSLFDHLYSSGDTVIISMETDWKKLMRSKAKKEYRPFSMALSTKDTTYQLPGRLRSRGNMRLVVCQNPSLKIKFKQKSLTAAGFSKLNDFKVVLQCGNSKLGQGYLRRERMVYGLHQIYSPDFHRTIPVRFKGLDDGEDILGFFIEDEEQLDARYDRALEISKISVKGLERTSYVNMCLFNYLILNTDWHVFNLHNVELVIKEGKRQPTPIPYDFDYSGFVGTSYALPREGLDISSIYVPYWLGVDVTEEELLAGAKHFLAQADAAAAFIQDYPDISKSDRKRLSKRLEDFNTLLSNEKKLLRLLRNQSSR